MLGKVLMALQLDDDGESRPEWLSSPKKSFPLRTGFPRLLYVPMPPFEGAA